uniref:Uncharacterized protein n=1 Tax=Oryza brachyantha TaxID=4533 RepID=J3MFB0_ORYBR
MDGRWPRIRIICYNNEKGRSRNHFSERSIAGPKSQKIRRASQFDPIIDRI